VTLKLVVGISGASGAPYAARLIEVLARLPKGTVEVGVCLSRTAPETWAHEVGTDLEALPFPLYRGRDYNAPFASGSAGWHAMVIVPCSMSQVARIAHGISDDLLTRAADVMSKERRKLVLVARESPYSRIHLQNMLAVTDAGAMVLPASPSFYGRPETLRDAVDSVVGRVLDHVGLDAGIVKRWGRDVSMRAVEGGR
jgi:4-hydroxy-3-polyprenylbenzoate decarboxylase